jgi:phosphatidylglycerol:prolipoprotein diacylglycerol transferase
MIEFPNLFSGVSVEVDRVAFNLLGLSVYWYGIFVTAAIVLGITYATKTAARVGILPDDVFEIAFWGVLTGVAGARLYYVIFSGESYTLPQALFGFRDGGLAIYGGLIGALTGGGLAAKAKRVKFAPLADLIGLGFLIGHSIGRWGNFFNQEAFGAATAENLPWGMTGDIIKKTPEVIAAQSSAGNVNVALVHPCFLYESLWCMLGFVILHLYIRKFKSFDGEIFLLYVAWYGSGRAFIESLRIDSLMAGGLRVSQVLAIASAVFALGVFIWLKTKKNHVLYKDTDESQTMIEEHKYRAKLEREKDKAKDWLNKTKRELTDPFNENIIDDE